MTTRLTQALRRLSVLFLLLPASLAATVTWDGGGDGSSWSDPLNWDTDALPGAADDVVIPDPAGTLRVTNHTDNITILSLQADASLVIEAGKLNLKGGPSEVRGDLILTSRKTLLVEGAGTTLTTAGSVQMDGASVTARGGAVVTLNGLASYTDTSGCCGALWKATDVDSLLAIPDLTELAGNPTWAMNVQATRGGQVSLPALTTVPDSHLRCYADGAGSRIDLPLLADLQQPRNRWLTLDARNTGVIHSPLLTDGRRVSVYLRGGGSVPLDQFTSFSLGSFNLGEGYDLSLPNLTGLDGTALVLTGGARLELPGVTSYTDNSGCCGALWKAEGAGALLSLPNLTELTGNPTWAMTLHARLGGEIRLPQLTTLPDSHLRCFAEGADSLIDLPALADLQQPRNRWLTLDARSGGQINVPLITEGRRVSIYLRDAGSVPVDQYTDLTLGNLDLGAGYDLSLPNLTHMDGASIKLGGGTRLELAGVTTYTDNSGCCGALWEAEGAGTLLSLPDLTELTGNPTWAMEIRARNGGEIRLPNLATLPDSHLRCFAEGTDSLVDLPALADLQQPRNRWLTLDARAGGKVNAPLILNGRRVSIVLRDDGSVPLDQYTDLTLGSLDLGGGYDVTLPNLLTFDGAKLVVSGGGRLELPGVTSFSDTGGCCGVLWQAGGAGGVLNLPNLAALIGNPNWAMNIQALDGGLVMLPAVEQVASSWLRFYADGEGSRLELPAMAGFEGNRGRLVFDVTNGGVVAVNEIFCALPATQLTLDVASVLEGGLIELGPGGFARVAGEIRASVINHTEFAPGSSPGEATVTGDFTQAPDGRLVIEVAGLEVGTELDRLTVTGRAALDGTLEARVIDDFAATPEQVFTVLTAAEVSGQFAGLADLTAGPSLEFGPAYAADRVDLTVGFSTGPRVVEVTPAGTAQDLLDEFSVRFSELLDFDSFTAADLELTGPAGTIPVEEPFLRPDGTWQVRFPAQRAEGDYTLQIGPDIADVAGNAMNQDEDDLNGEPEDVFETTVFLDDNQGPLVADFTPLGPLSGQVTALIVTFTEPVAPGTFDAADLVVLTPGGPLDPALLQLETTDNITHTIHVPAQTAEGLYTVTVGPDLTDLAGTPMPEPFVGQFTLDHTAPRVTGVAPSGEVGEALSFFDVTFDSMILADSFTPADVGFATPGGPVAIERIEPRPANTFRLHFPLQGATGDYTLTVGPDITDPAGNRLNQDGDDRFGERPEDQFVATLMLRAPDLVVTDVQAPADARPGERITVTWTLQNPGNADVPRAFVELIALSADALPGEDLPLATVITEELLPAGGTLARSAEVTLPLTGPAGPIHLVVTTDVNQEIGESDEANNIAVAAAATEVPLTLSVLVGETTLTEGATGSARILRNGPTASALRVALAVDDATELTVPAEVTLPPGQSEAPFTVEAALDNQPDGPQTATMTVTAGGFEFGTAGLTVLDADVPRLTLALTDTSLGEGETTTGTLTREGDLSAPLEVALGTSSPGQISLPARATIPAGEAAATFDLLAVDDDYVESTRGYSVTADAAGFERSSATVTVADNDAPGLTAELDRDRFFEGAGPNAATLTLTRTVDSIYPVHVRLTASVPDLLRFQEEVVFNPGEFVQYVPLTPVDDDVIEENQPLTLMAEPLETLALNPLGAGAAVDLTILDDDGPGLRLRFSRDWVCGGDADYPSLDQVTATLTRTGETTDAATVALAVDEAGWLDFPDTVGFSAGSDTAVFTVTATAQHPVSPGQAVTFTATADGYHDGVATLWRSADCRPDLIIENLEAPAAGLTDEFFAVSYRERNIGVGFRVGDMLVLDQTVWLSDDPAVGDDAELGRVIFDGTIENYVSLDRSATFRLPSVPGDYWVIVEADGSNRVGESSEFNNFTVAATPLHVDPAYTATVQAGLDVAPAGTPVPLSGTATRWGGNEPAPFELVSLHIGLRDTVRTIAALTDADGRFEATFVPLPGEAGTYTVAATHPGVSHPPAQDTFTLLGLRATPATLERVIPALTTVEETVVLENLGDVTLTGLSVEILGAPAEFTVEAALDDGLAPFGQGTLSLQLTATQDVNVSRTFTVRVRSAEGAVADVILTLTSESLRPRLAAGPALIAGVVPGTQRFLEFTVTNEGGAPSGPLNVLPPPVPFLGVVSPTPLPPLQPGDSTVVNLRLAPAPDEPFAEFRGNLAVSDGTASAQVPYTFRVLSEATGTLEVEVTDQFTYYAEGAPRVVGARVQLRDPYNGTVLFTGESDEAGLAGFPDIREGWYDLTVTADDHAPFRETIFVSAGVTTHEEALMAAQTVQFFWSVVPVEREDRTRITIEAVFETVVPVPVVTVEPAVIDLANYPNGGVINLTVENHGLLAAQNVRMSFSNFDCYRLTPLISELGTLAAKSAMVVPVEICRDPACLGNFERCDQPGARAVKSVTDREVALAFRQVRGSGGGGCGGGALVYTVPCGNGAVGGSAPIAVNNAGGGGCGGGGSISGGGGGGGGSINPGGGAGASDCNPCGLELLKELAKCGFDLFVPIPDLVKCLQGINKCYSKPNPADCISAALDCLSAAGKEVPYLGTAITLYCCAENLSYACGGDGLGGPSLCGNGGGGPGGPGVGGFSHSAASRRAVGLAGAPFANPLDSGAYPGMPEVAVAALRARAVLEVFSQIFGGNDWLMAGTSPNFQPWFELLSASVAADSEEGHRLSTAEETALREHPFARDFSDEKIGRFVARWNRTMDYYGAGTLDRGEVPQGQSSDFIARDEFLAQVALAEQAQQEAEAAGFATPFEELEAKIEQLRAFLHQPNGGICAQVRLRIEQEAVIARDAFQATLEIENGTETPLAEVAVELAVANEAGEIVTPQFLIPEPSLRGLGAIDGTGQVEPGTTGVAQWDILPTTDTAITGPTVYFVSGTIRYRQNGALTTVPLAPTAITVYPLAQLHLTYFHERDVLADDPFTDEVEPSVPYSLAVMVRNDGYGTARNVRITSAQPQIVDNEKGLFVDFQIIATQVNGQNLVPSLTANFGDIGPGRIGIGRWLLKSTLQGLFVDYSADFKHLDGLGEERASIIQSVEIKELIRLVELEGPFGDGLPDMLANDFPDIQDLPDALYLSDGSVEPVAIQTEGEFTGALSPDQLELTLVTTPRAGWTYLRLPDPADERFELVEVRRPDGATLGVDNVVWRTDRTFIGGGKRPVMERRLHLLDHDSPGRYTLRYEPRAEPDLTPPTSAVAALPARSFPNIPLAWSGADTGGSGLATYDLYVADNGGPFALWLEKTALSGAVYPGEFGHEYAFYSVATDLAGNREPAPDQPDAVTRADRENTAPVLTVTADVTLDEGQTVRLANRATDDEADVQTLFFSLGPDAPPGAVIDPQTGLVTWATGEGAGPGEADLTVIVTDNGEPPLSDQGVVHVTIREVNQAPTVQGPREARVNEGDLLELTFTASDTDLPANTLTFALGDDAPAGASIDAVTGVFTWAPTPLQGPSTNTIPVLVTDDGEPPLTGRLDLEVVVLDRLGDFLLALGRTHLLVGQSGSVPLELTADSVARVDFTLTLPEGHLENLALEPVAPDLLSASLTPTGPGAYAGVLEFDPARLVNGAREVARLRFDATAGAPSDILPLLLPTVQGVMTDGTLLTDARVRPGRVIVVNVRPVLEAANPRAPELRLYGRPGATYAIEAATTLGPAALWNVIEERTLTEQLLVIPDAGLPDANLFYRLRETAPPPGR